MNNLFQPNLRWSSGEFSLNCHVWRGMTLIYFFKLINPNHLHTIVFSFVKRLNSDSPQPSCISSFRNVEPPVCTHLFTPTGLRMKLLIHFNDTSRHLFLPSVRFLIWFLCSVIWFLQRMISDPNLTSPSTNYLFIRRTTVCSLLFSPSH